MINLDDDGITHINVYSKGKTSLGRWLSNFSTLGFVHYKYGSFASMEGYWYFIKTGHKHNHLKLLSGYTAKLEGRKLPVVENPNFEEDIIQGLRLKIFSHPILYDALKDNTLPLHHYMVKINNHKKIIIPSKSESFLINCICKVKDLIFLKNMRIIIAGSRSINDRNLLYEIIKKSGVHISKVISGGAKGVDKMGESFAKEHNIPHVIYKAEWDKYSKHQEGKNPAGAIRNLEMANVSDGVIALWDGKSPGTKDMISHMVRMKKLYYVYNLLQNRITTNIEVNQNGDFYLPKFK